MDKPNPDATPPPRVPKRIFLVPFKTKYDSAKDADGKQKSAIEKLSPQLKREDGAVPLDSLQALLSYDLTKLDDVDSGLEFDVAHFYPTIDAQDSLEQIVAKLGQVKDKKIKIVLTADQRLATKTVKQGESYQLLFLPLACDRIVWLERAVLEPGASHQRVLDISHRRRLLHRGDRNEKMFPDERRTSRGTGSDPDIEDRCAGREAPGIFRATIPARITDCNELQGSVWHVFAVLDS